VTNTITVGGTELRAPGGGGSDDSVAAGQQQSARGPLSRGGFLSYIHSFRGAAILAVVATHVTDLLTWNKDQPVTEHLSYSIFQNGTVLFLFIAGLLFQYLSGRFRYSKYITGKLRNVILPYIIISIPAIVYEYLRHGGIFAPDYPRRFDNPVLHVAWSYLSAAQLPVPFWFIPVIFILQVLAPVLLAVDRRPLLYWIIPPLTVLAMFCHRPADLTHIWHAFAYFAPAYIAGMWCSHYRESIITRIAQWRIPLWGIAAALVVIEVFVLDRGGAIFSRAPFSMEAGILDLNLPLKLLVSFLLVELLYRYDHVCRNKFSYLADTSFGIFFLHKYIIRFFDQVLLPFAGINHISGSPWAFLVLVPLVTSFSVALVALFRLVLGKRSRLVIGC
jgi:probable poly-beta-1,6-N-acetyl-D-glucosamine export protein